MSATLSVKSCALLLCGLLIANITIYRMIFIPRTLTVSTLDVGKAGEEAKTAEGGSPDASTSRGSATLVRTPSGATILIDTGPDASILRALGTTLPPWQRSLDAIILTSDKRASAGGLPDILDRYRVGQQVPLTGDRRLNLGDGTYIDLSLPTKNAPAGVSVFDGTSMTKIR